MAGSAIRPIRGKPGVFQVAGLDKPIRLVEWREDAVYDTIEILANGQAASSSNAGALSTAYGSTAEFFDTLTAKKRRDTNLNKVHALPAGWEVIVTKLGTYCHVTTGNVSAVPNDLKQVYENAALIAQINDTVIADGWVGNYQLGVGLYGNTVENGQGVIAPATPSIGAAPTLLVPQEINDAHDIRCQMRFDAFAWTTSFGAGQAASLGNAVTVKFMLRGFVKRPLSKG